MRAFSALSVAATVAMASVLAPAAVRAQQPPTPDTPEAGPEDDRDRDRAPAEPPAETEPKTAPASVAAPPVVVAAVAETELQDGAVDAIASAVAGRLGAEVRGREVRVVDDPQAWAVCLGEGAEPDTECLGRAISDVGAAAGVLVRLARPEQDGPTRVRLEAFDAVSGTRRGEPIALSIAAEQQNAPDEALAPGVAQLAAHMPGPPPARASLLIAANVDGATVRIDGDAVGETPLGPVELPPGRHTVTVTAQGFRPFNSSVGVDPAKRARVNVDLAPTTEQQRSFTQADAGRDSPSEPLYDQWYFWAAVGGAVAAVVVAGVVIAVAGGGGGGNPDGFPVPPIQP